MNKSTSEISLTTTHATNHPHPKRLQSLRDFLRRQFDGKPTYRQKIFDIIFGIGLPIFCFVFDPIVFREHPGEKFQWFAYASLLFETGTLGIWLSRPTNLGLWPNIAGGIMLAGSLVAWILGLIILPLSLLGLLFGIGILGFTPFLTGFVYLRNGVRALRCTVVRHPVLALVGFILTLGLPAVIQRGVTKSVSQSMIDIPDGRILTPANIIILKSAGHLGGAFDRLVWLYEDEKDPMRKAHLAKAYADLTGSDIGRRLNELQSKD